MKITFFVYLLSLSIHCNKHISYFPLTTSGHPFLAKLGPVGTDSPHFCTGQDCLWDSKNQHRKWAAQLICFLFLYGTRLHLGQRGATQGTEWNVYSLFCSGPIQKQGVDQLCSPFSVLLLAALEAISSHAKVRSIFSVGLSLQRGLCARILTTVILKI